MPVPAILQPLILIFSNVHVCILRLDRFLSSSIVFLFDACCRLAITVMTIGLCVSALHATKGVVRDPFHVQLANIWDLVRGIDELHIVSPN